MRWVLAAIVFASCGSPPPPKAPTPQVEVAGPASFAGSWVTDGELDWGYTLVIDPQGRYLLAIDRGKMGKCEKKGVLAQTSDPRNYSLVFTKNTCDQTATPALAIKVESFTGDELALLVTGDGTERRPIYKRDPKLVQQ